MDLGWILEGFWEDFGAILYHCFMNFLLILKFPTNPYLKKKGRACSPRSGSMRPAPCGPKASRPLPCLPTRSLPALLYRRRVGRRGPRISKKKSTKKSIPILTSFFLRFFRFLIDFGAKILSKMEPKSSSERDLVAFFGDLLFRRVFSSIFW